LFDGFYNPQVRGGDSPVRRLALQQVRATHRLAEAANTNRIEAIQAARDVGCSWDDIGEEMSLSRQTVHKRFGQLVSSPDPARLARIARLEAIVPAILDGEQA
jgi:hypothetical protein